MHDNTFSQNFAERFKLIKKLSTRVGIRLRGILRLKLATGFHLGCSVSGAAAEVKMGRNALSSLFPPLSCLPPHPLVSFTSHHPFSMTTAQTPRPKKKPLVVS